MELLYFLPVDRSSWGYQGSPASLLAPPWAGCTTSVGSSVSLFISRRKAMGRALTQIYPGCPWEATELAERKVERT